jgi:hypothetical protein
MEVLPVLPISEQNSLLYFEGTLKIFRAIMELLFTDLTI